MKRAYSYLFGGAAPVPEPPSTEAPTTDEDTTTSSKDAKPQSLRDNGIDTPPETPRHAPLSEDEAGAGK